MKSFFLLLLFVAVISVQESESFAVVTPLVARRIAIQRPTTSTRINASSKDEEIAALEEKLRLLKEETDASTAAEAETDAETDADTLSEEPSRGWKPTPSTTPPPQRPAAITNVDDPLYEMLSESWKDSDASSSEGGGAVMKNLMIAGIALLAAIAFSQVPVGNEGYDRYSAAKPNTSIDLG